MPQDAKGEKNQQHASCNQNPPQWLAHAGGTVFSAGATGKENWRRAKVSDATLQFLLKEFRLWHVSLRCFGQRQTVAARTLSGRGVDVPASKRTDRWCRCAPQISLWRDR